MVLIFFDPAVVLPGTENVKTKIYEKTPGKKECLLL